MGGKLYILTNSKDVATAYNNTTTLSFEQYVQAVMRTSGCSESAVQKMYQDADLTKTIMPNPNKKPLIKLARDIHKQQLFPGEQFDVLLARFIDYFHRGLSIVSIAQCSYASFTTGNEIVLPLSDLASDVFISAGQEAYFGRHLAEVNPNLPWTFRDFDDLTWQVFYQYPRRFASKMHQAKDKIIADLGQYFEATDKKRADAAWFIHCVEAELKGVGFSKHDVAVMMMTIAILLAHRRFSSCRIHTNKCTELTALSWDRSIPHRTPTKLLASTNTPTMIYRPCR